MATELLTVQEVAGEAGILGVSNALLLDQSLPTFIGHNLDKIGDGIRIGGSRSLRINLLKK